jgi:hypothetical protein
LGLGHGGHAVFRQDSESKSSWDPPWLINRKYGNRQTSGLAVEVIEKAEVGAVRFSGEQIGGSSGC